jgi:hypothetical protein
VEDVARSSNGAAPSEEIHMPPGLAVPLLAEEKMLGVLAFTIAGPAGTPPSALLLRIQSIARILVVLNLIVNALESFANRASVDRHVMVRSTRSDQTSSKCP